MKNKPFRLYYLLACLGVLIAAWYPISMGVRVIADMLQNGVVQQEDYPKYIIPYTPMAIAIFVGVGIMPLCFRLCKKYALAAGAAVATGVFFALEFLLEQKVIVSAAETVTTLESWQMVMCYAPPGGWGETVTVHKTKTAVEILMGEYSPAFKLHFYMIALVLILAILNSLYGFGHMVRTGEKKRRKSLILQSVCAVTFLGLCILACFTAFWRDGNILVSPLSAVLMAVFFILLGVTAGSFAGSFLLGKRPLLSVGLPGLLASGVTLLMYVGEMFLLSGYLYLLGRGPLFQRLPGIVLAPVDILIILASGGITACVFALLHGITRRPLRILTAVLCLLFAAIAFLPLLSPWKTTGIEPTHRQELVLPSDCGVQLLETVSNESESSYQVGADLPATDLSSIGQPLSEALEKEWKTYDSLTQEQRLVSSKLWGVVSMQAETWGQCQKLAGISIANPLENLDWLEHTWYFGTESQDTSEPISHVQLLAQTDHDRTLRQIDMTAGYAFGDIRVTLTATVCADAKTYTTGSVHNGYADYWESFSKTRTGITALIVTPEETNNTGYYNADFYDPTAYWADGNVLYTLRVYGKQENWFESYSLLTDLLTEL